MKINKDFLLPDRCEHYLQSRMHRAKDRIKKLDDSHTGGYNKTGCYECDGNNKKCQDYVNPLEEYLKNIFYKL